MDEVLSIALPSMDSGEDHARFSRLVPIAVSGPTRELRRELHRYALGVTLKTLSERHGMDGLERYLKRRGVVYDIHQADDPVTANGYVDDAQEYVLAGIR